MAEDTHRRKRATPLFNYVTATTVVDGERSCGTDGGNPKAGSDRWDERAQRAQMEFRWKESY